MPDFSGGVSGYVKANCNVTVFFPVDKRGAAEICCKHCQYYSRYNKACKLNDKPIFFPDTAVGKWCPLKLEEQKNE